MPDLPRILPQLSAWRRWLWQESQGPPGTRKATHPNLSRSSFQWLANPRHVWRDMEFGIKLFKAFSVALAKPLFLSGPGDDTQPALGQSLPGGPWSQERTVVEGARVLQCPSDAALHWSFQSFTQSLAGLFLGYLLPSSKMLPEPAESGCFTITTCCVWAVGLEM